MTAPHREAAPTSAFLEQAYALVSVTRAASPIAEDARDWHCYVITQGTNRIVGHRPGSLESVRSAAETLVGRLNERRSSPSRRHGVILGPPRKS